MRLSHHFINPPYDSTGLQSGCSEGVVYCQAYDLAQIAINALSWKFSMLEILICQFGIALRWIEWGQCHRQPHPQ